MGNSNVFISKPFVKHLAIALAVFFLLLWITLKFIGCYTRHGVEILVPNLIGINIHEIGQLASSENLEFVVIDSVYQDGFEKGAVVLQDPPARAMVKKGRKVYLTIMSSQPEMVSMPNLVDLSLRQALGLLKTAGLKVGKLEYVDNFAKNAVLDQQFEDAFITPGTKLEKGSFIKMTMGKGLDTEKIPIPFLIGKTEDEAYDLLNNASLNVGAINYFDEKDKIHSRVYLQSPSPRADTSLVFGSSIDLWLRSDLDFDFKKLIQSMESDTLTSDSLSLGFDSIF